MSLKAKIEAVIYASEEPVTLAQLTGLLGHEAQAELDHLDSAQRSLALDESAAVASGEEQPESVAAGQDSVAAGQDEDGLNNEVLPDDASEISSPDQPDGLNEPGHAGEPDAEAEASVGDETEAQHA